MIPNVMDVMDRLTLNVKCVGNIHTLMLMDVVNVMETGLVHSADSTMVLVIAHA